MAQGDKFYETRDGHTYYCIVLVETEDELVIEKFDINTREVRIDRYRPNFNYNEKHYHEYMDNGKYGVHFPEANKGDKKRFYDAVHGNNDDKDK